MSKVPPPGDVTPRLRLDQGSQTIARLSLCILQLHSIHLPLEISCCKGRQGGVGLEISLLRFLPFSGRHLLMFGLVPKPFRPPEAPSPAPPLHQPELLHSLQILAQGVSSSLMQQSAPSSISTVLHTTAHRGLAEIAQVLLCMSVSLHQESGARGGSALHKCWLNEWIQPILNEHLCVMGTYRAGHKGEEAVLSVHMELICNWKGMQCTQGKKHNSHAIACAC